MKANKSRGGYSKAMPSDLRLAREAREAAEADPAAEAKRREERMLASLVGAREDFEWIAARKGWTLLGFDTCFDWWSAHVRPVADGLGLRPEPEFAKRVIALVEQEQAALPTTQRSSKKELAELVGASEWAARGRKETRQRRSAAGADLDPSSVIDVEPTSVTDEPTETETDDPDPADIPAAVTQLLTEAAAASVGAGVTMPAARPVESPCSDAPDRAHCARAGCGVELSGNDQQSGHLRCLACDPSTLHKAVGIGVEEGYGECDECAIQARIAERTSAASVAAANQTAAGDVKTPADAGDPSTTSVPAAGSGDGSSLVAGPGLPPSAAEPVGTGLGSGELEERIEEEAVEGSDVDLSSFDAAYLSADDLAALDSPAADPIEPSHAGVPAAGVTPEDAAEARRRVFFRSADEEQFHFGVDSVLCGGTGDVWFEDVSYVTCVPCLDAIIAAFPLNSPVGPDHPVATTVLPGIDHHTSAGVSDSGVAPEVRALVEPVLEDGGLAPDLPSSSDPRDETHPGDRLLHALGVLVNLLGELDPEALGPYLFPHEVDRMHEQAERIAAFVGRVGLARQQLAGTP